MNELDLLIENYFTESFETSELFRLVEEIMDAPDAGRKRNIELAMDAMNSGKALQSLEAFAELTQAAGGAQ